MSHDHLPFREWVRQEADLIGSDGCSFATGARRICCDLHDLHYFFGRSAGSAYRLYLQGVRDYWAEADVITRAFADDEFIDCNRRESWLGFFSPIAFIRQLIKPFGQKAWDQHRAREQQAET